MILLTPELRGRLQRIMGRKVSPAWVVSASAIGVSALTPEGAHAALVDGKTVLDLAEGLQLRRVRVMGASRIELTGFTDAMRERLTGYGLFHRDLLLEAPHVRADRRRRHRCAAQGARTLSARTPLRAGRLTMPGYAGELARRLAREAEAVCRQYLSNGRREGRYWLVGDVKNTPGRSMFVRLSGPEIRTGRGRQMDRCRDRRARRPTRCDSRATCALDGFHDVESEARRFLSLPRRHHSAPKVRPATAPTGSPESARRLFAMSQPIRAHSWKRTCAIAASRLCAEPESLHFHPHCYYRPDRDIADRELAGDDRRRDRPRRPHHRRAPHLARSRRFRSCRLGKAPIDSPRRAMGNLLGQRGALRHRAATLLAAGEGIETMLSLRCVCPTCR